MQPIRRRSCLSVPGSSASMLVKAPTRGADEIVIDLEDAVATSAKDEARETVVAALFEPHYDGVLTAVRVNAPRSPWCHQDVAALASLARGPASLVVPKVQSAGDMAFVERLLDGVEAAAGRNGEPMRVQALIETAAGVDRLSEIAAASPRLDALILGYRGPAGIARPPGRRRRRARLVARDPGRDHRRRARERSGRHRRAIPRCRHRRGFCGRRTSSHEMGFDGKWAIHPAQVAALNELFTPEAQELEHARAVVAALEQAERRRPAGEAQSRSTGRCSTRRCG